MSTGDQPVVRSRSVLELVVDFDLSWAERGKKKLDPQPVIFREFAFC